MVSFPFASIVLQTRFVSRSLPSQIQQFKGQDVNSPETVTATEFPRQAPWGNIPVRVGGLPSAVTVPARFVVRRAARNVIPRIFML